MNIPAGTMTEQLCLDTCSTLNYQFAGLEYGGECWCYNFIMGGNGPVTSGCDMACLGDPTELCGGSLRLSMFTNAAYAPTTYTVTNVTGWDYLGCYTDQLDTRALSNAIYFDSAMTVQKCLDFCVDNNQPIAGVEYGTQCYCGSALPSWSASNPTNMDPVQYGCDMPCGGIFLILSCFGQMA
jgi:WSC domain